MPETVSGLAEVARLATAVAWGIGAFFLRDVYREFKELRADVHGKGGIGERVARLEGQRGSSVQIPFTD